MCDAALEDGSSSSWSPFRSNKSKTLTWESNKKILKSEIQLKDSGKRRVVAFIGGLDITNGRYDDPTFPLWSTLQTTHYMDFLNACTPGATHKTGPREPWHDCHARVEGPVTFDLVRNFEDRVVKQGRESLPFMYDITEQGVQLNIHFFLPECGPEPGPSHVWSFETCPNL